jgi:hypothetical protein
MILKVDFWIITKMTLPKSKRSMVKALTKTDQQWKLMEERVPIRKKRGKPPVDSWKGLNGILYALKTGCA